MGVLSDYSRQAQRYDETRGASPSALRPIREALGASAPGRMADIGGGTGNYANALRQEGWSPLVVDCSRAMLDRAADKGLEVLEADAQQLPLDSGSFDAVLMISMLHHVDDVEAALSEARRILRSGGTLVLMGYAGEDAASLWVLDYFPVSRPWIEATHPPRATFLELLPGAELTEFTYRDMQDASLAALSADPAKIVQAAESGATSYFERMARDHPGELEAGLRRLREDMAAHRAPARAGTGTVLTWTKS